MRSAQLQEMLADAALAPDDQVVVAGLLGPLARSGEVAPEPSAALAALFGEPAAGDEVGSVVPRRGPVRRWRVRTAAAGAVVLAVSSVGATGLSAAANSLPSVVQHHVSEFSRHYLPFDFPEPRTRTDQPLGQGRMPRAQHVITPHPDGESSRSGDGSPGAVAPHSRERSAHPSQAGPAFLVPGSAVETDQQASSQDGYVLPSASPSPSPSASPSPNPTGLKSTAKPAPTGSPSPSPAPAPEDSHTGKGTGHAGSGGNKPGKGEDPSPGKRPGKTPGKPGRTPANPGGSTTGSDPGRGTGTAGDGSGGESGTTPAIPDPSGVLPEMPIPQVLPDLSFGP